jgi:PRTRC genetic system ThiF family protein
VLTSIAKTKYKHYVSPEISTGKDGRPVSILLIGAGGNGGQMITGIARTHFALRALGHPGINLAAMDGDNVGPENVGRQLFSEADIGRNKAETLITRVNMFFGLKWTAYPLMFRKNHAKELSKSRVNIVITAVDKVPIREVVSKAVKGTKMYMLDLGNSKDAGQVILGTGVYVKQPKNAGDCLGHLPTVIDLFPNLREEEKKSYQGPSCGVAAALRRQDLFINTAISTYALHLLWECFTKPYLRDHGVFVNLATKRTNPLPVNPAVWQQMGWAPIQTLRKAA